MVKDRDLFLDLDLSEQGTVGCANASTSTIEGSGTAAFWIKDAEGRMRRMELKDALYVPSYSHNLVSVKRLLDQGVKVQFEEPPRLVAPDGTIFPMKSFNNLFSLEVFVEPKQKGMQAQTMTRWHERLGHTNKRDVSLLEKNVDGMNISSGDSGPGVCEPCVTQKAKRASMKKTWGTRATETLEIVHTDVLGPLHIPSVDGYRYAIGFIDSFSRYSTVYMMRTRDECLTKLELFVADVGVPRTLVTDGAMEYKSGAFEMFCRARSFRNELSTPYVPEDNGKV